MKKITLIVVFIILFTFGCASSVVFKIVNIKMENSDKNLKTWVFKNSKNGVYLAKSNQYSKKDIYIVYINRKSIGDDKKYIGTEFSVSSNEKGKLEVNTSALPSEEPSERIFSIIVDKDSVKKIVLNGNDIMESTIPIEDIQPENIIDEY